MAKKFKIICLTFSSEYKINIPGENINKPTVPVEKLILVVLDETDEFLEKTIELLN